MEEVRKEIKEWGRKEQLTNKSFSCGAGQRGRSVPWGACLPEAETTVCGCIPWGTAALLFVDQALERPVCAVVHMQHSQAWLPSLPWAGQGRMLFEY